MILNLLHNKATYIAVCFFTFGDLQNTTVPFYQPLYNRKHHFLHFESLEKV